MWTNENRSLNDRSQLRYPSDLIPVFAPRCFGSCHMPAIDVARTGNGLRLQQFGGGGSNHAP